MPFRHSEAVLVHKEGLLCLACSFVPESKKEAHYRNTHYIHLQGTSYS